MDPPATLAAKPEMPRRYEPAVNLLPTQDSKLYRPNKGQMLVHGGYNVHQARFTVTSPRAGLGTKKGRDLAVAGAYATHNDADRSTRRLSFFFYLSLLLFKCLFPNSF